MMLKRFPGAILKPRSKISISMDGVTENCSCIFCTSYILVGRMLEIVRNDSSPPLNKPTLRKGHYFVTDNDVVQYSNIDHV